MSYDVVRGMAKYGDSCGHCAKQVSAGGTGGISWWNWWKLLLRDGVQRAGGQNLETRERQEIITLTTSRLSLENRTWIVFLKDCAEPHKL